MNEQHTQEVLINEVLAGKCKLAESNPLDSQSTETEAKTNQKLGQMKTMVGDKTSVTSSEESLEQVKDSNEEIPISEAKQDDSQSQQTKEQQSQDTGDTPPKQVLIGPTRPRCEEMNRVTLLGTGNFSSIYLVEEYKTHKKFAMKQYAKHDAERRKKTQDLIMEKYVLNKLNGCKRVVHLYETFKDELNIYFNMEYLAGGELWEISHCFGLPSRFEIKYFLYKILLAVEECHQRGIIHRDLKPENIMLTEHKTDLKLIDFATSWDFQNPSMKGSGNGSTGRRVYYHFVGTPQYMPVELFRNKGSYTATDVYAIGCIAYLLMCGFPPFLGPGEYNIFKEADQCKLKFYDFISEQERDFLSKMIVHDYMKRATIENLKAHLYFDDHRDQYEATAEKWSDIENKRTEQEKWLLQLREQVCKAVKDIDGPEDTQKEKESDTQNSETKEVTDPEQPQEPKEPVTEHTEPDIKNREVKVETIRNMLNEALKGTIPTGGMTEAEMKSRIKHLAKQINHKFKLKVFEHYC